MVDKRPIIFDDMNHLESFLERILNEPERWCSLSNNDKIIILYGLDGCMRDAEATKVYNELLPFGRKESVEDENKENLPPDDTKSKNVPGTPSLKSVQKESVEDENKEHIPPDDTKIPEREIKRTSC